MKKGLFAIILVMALSFAAVPAMASLEIIVWDNGDPLVVKCDDNGSVTYWYADLLALEGTYAENLALVAAISVPGYTGWHMASQSEMNELKTNSAETIAGSFQPTDYYPLDYTNDWCGRYENNVPRDVMCIYYDGDIEEYDYFTPEAVGDDTSFASWAVTLVPEPASLVIFGIAAAGMGAKRMRRR